MKKKLLLAFAFLLTVGVASAQIVTFQTPTNLVAGTTTNPDDDELETNWVVTNNTTNTISIRCSAAVLTLVEGSKYQFCWGTLCSAWLGYSGSLPDPVTLAPGESTNTFHLKFRHYANAGQSTVRFTWTDVNSPSSNVSYDVNFCVDTECVVGVQEVKQTANIAQISPNPVVTTSNITYDFATMPNGGKMQIHNMVGGLVKEIILNDKSGAVVIKAADFESGIYFCSIQCDGKVFETKRLVISK
jgi:hypothetical protein